MLTTILSKARNGHEQRRKQVQRTQHAFLVIWGWFAGHIGLPGRFEHIPLKQKRYQHTLQTKVLEFLVSILGGVQYLQDISQAAHPLDKDQAVAEAWGQPGWAEYSGVSRILTSLSWEEARQIAKVLEEIGQGFLDAELHLLRTEGKRLQYDGDLTGRPVSNTSQTFPNAAFGHMDDEIRLGYQAAVVSLISPTYGRLWLSGTHHPGDTVSCTQAENMVLAAEARTGLRPKRRTDLLRQRIDAFEQQVAETKKRQEVQGQALQQAKEDLATDEQQQQERQTQLAALEKDYQERERKERPASSLALTRQRAQAAQNAYTADRIHGKKRKNGLSRRTPPTLIRCKPTFAWMLALAPMITWRCWSNSGTRSIPNRTATML